MQATAKDLRFRTKELIEAVTRGEEVVITYRGKPRAKLMPYIEIKTKSKKTEMFGMWRDKDDVKSVDDYIREIRKARF